MKKGGNLKSDKQALDYYLGIINDRQIKSDLIGVTGDMVFQ